MDLIILARLEYLQARKRFNLLDAMEVGDLDGPHYLAWAAEHQAAWNYMIDLMDYIRARE